MQLRRSIIERQVYREAGLDPEEETAKKGEGAKKDDHHKKGDHHKKDDNHHKKK